MGDNKYFLSRLTLNKSNFIDIFLTVPALILLYLALYTFGIAGFYKVLLIAFYGGCLILTGFLCKLSLLTVAGCIVLAVSCFFAWWPYYLYASIDDIRDFTLLFGGLALIFSFLYLSLRLISNERQAALHTAVKQLVGALVLCTFFFMIKKYIIFSMHFYQTFAQAKTLVDSFFQYFMGHKETLHGAKNLRVQYEMALVAYYTVTGLLLVMSGFAYKTKYIRYAGLLLLFIVLAKLGFFIGMLQDTGLKIKAFLIVGCIFMIAFYIYHLLAKRERLQN